MVIMKKGDMVRLKVDEVGSSWYPNLKDKTGIILGFNTDRFTVNISYVKGKTISFQPPFWRKDGDYMENKALYILIDGKCQWVEAADWEVVDDVQTGP